MDEYISREAVLQKFLERGSGYINELTMRDMINEIPTADVQPVKKTEFQIGYEQGYKDGVAGAVLPNVNDNGDKIDGYSYAYKTDSRGEPYIHIDSVRGMLKKAAVQPVDRWISIEDKLPETNAIGIAHILAYDRYEGVVKADFLDESANYCYGSNIFQISNTSAQLYKVTHWQPLPESPKDGDM